MNKILTPLVSAAFLLSACGDSKETDTSQAPATDTTAIADSLAEEQNDGPSHPVSGWGENPPAYFDSPRVEELVNAKEAYTPTDDEGIDYVHDHLNKAEMKKLNVRELIYYCLKYPCSFSQICADSYYPDSSGIPKILGYFDFAYSSEMMSEWQTDALENRSDSVVLVLNNYIKKNPKDLHEDYFKILLHLKSYESIPLMIETASPDRLLNYTYLLVMMFENKYAPFQETGMYERLYGDNSWNFGSRIEATPENMDTIKTLAKKMYTEFKSK